MQSYGLISTFELDAAFNYDAYTRCDVKTGSYSLIDGILISRGLSSLVDNVRISYYGNNVSDHFPVEIDLHVAVTTISPTKITPPPFINWKKLSQDDLTYFRDRMRTNLNQIPFPSDMQHGSHICLNDAHKIEIENYYDDLVKAVLDAESVLPKSRYSAQVV